VVLGLDPGTRDEALLTSHRPRGTSERPRSLVARHRERLVMVMEIELTDAMIAAMAKADARVCVGSDRCDAFRDRLDDARRSCTPKGRCTVGGTRRVIIGRGGRESWDVWLEVRTALVKLGTRANG
jgi:hypothetical protein